MVAKAPPSSGYGGKKAASKSAAAKKAPASGIPPRPTAQEIATRNLPKAGDSTAVAVGKQWANAKTVTRASKAKEASRNEVLRDQANARNRSAAAKKSGKK